MCESGDTLALLAGTYPAFYFDADGEPVTVDAPEGRYSITTYDASGAILSTVPLTEVYPEEPRGFDGGSGAYDLLFAERVVKIGAEAFKDCYGFGSIYIPATVKSIGKDVFLLGNPNAKPRKYTTVRCAKGSAAMEYCIENEVPYTAS